MKKQILVIAEHLKGKILPVTLQAVSFARELGQGLGLRTEALILGSGIETPALDLARTSGVDVTGIQGDHLDPYNGEAWKVAVTSLLEDEAPSYICLPHTSTGFDLAPRLAFSMGASCITSVLKVRVSKGEARFIRPMFNNKLHAEITPVTANTVLTVLPGRGSFPKEGPETRGKARIVETDHLPVQSQTLEIKGSQKEGLNLGDAEVIVSAGRGIGRQDNLHLLEELAKVFPRSALGSSKAVCDLGWLPYKHQVGVTGQTVAPGLYLACGISGAPQHIAGMGGSKMIVAINTDPDASIFNVSHYCVVEDLETFIPVLLKVLKSPSGP